MIDLKEIKALNKLKTKGTIVSLYLNTDQSQHNSEEIFLELKNLLTKAEDALKENDAVRITDRVKLRLDQATKSLVFIIDPEKNIWYEYRFHKPIGSGIYLEKNAHIKPLLWLIDEYESYLTIFLDKESARMFVTYLGEIEDITSIVDKSFPGKHAQGGWSQRRFSAHIDNHVIKNLKRYADQVYKLYKKDKFQRIILTGSKEILPEFVKLMHNDIRKLVVAKFPSEKWENQNQVLEQSLQVEERVEREEEEKAVAELADNLGDGNKAVSGIKDVLRALNEKRVMKLVVNKKFNADGFQCLECDQISKDENCNCGEKGTKVGDLIDEAMQKALSQKAVVEIVKESAKLDELGGIGAMVRF